MISIILLFCCLSGLVSSDPYFYHVEDAEFHFEEFIKTFDKQYSSDIEKQERFEIFKKNLEAINENNIGGPDEAVYGITKFSDWTTKEYMSVYGSLTFPEGPGPCQMSAHNYSGAAVPDEWDWRTQNKVTRVKNQGSCGSCWTFSTAGNVEGQYAIKHNKLVDMSTQQLLDCDKGNFGCQGGLMNKAILYLQKAGGMMAWQDYPYQGRESSCQFSKAKVTAQVTGCTQFTFSSEDELRAALVTEGPLTVGVYPDRWIQYRGGIMTDCRQSQLAHAVLLVGYGTENGVPYWIIKNSSGSNWGEKGYIRIKRNVNACNMMQNGGAYIVTAKVA